MVGVVVVSHLNLGKELVSTAERIIGPLKAVESISIGLGDSSDMIREKIAEAIARVDAGQGVVVLTDTFGGSATNVALPFLAEGKVEILTGMNLPMMIKLSAIDRHTPLDALCRELRDYGQRNISLATEILSARRSQKKAKEEPEGGGQ